MGHHKIGLYLIFRGLFSEGQGTEWRIFWGLLKLQIFIWVLESHIFFFFWGGGGDEQ